jgi:hypothetical protein
MAGPVVGVEAGDSGAPKCGGRAEARVRVVSCAQSFGLVSAR